MLLEKQYFTITKDYDPEMETGRDFQAGLARPESRPAQVQFQVGVWPGFCAAIVKLSVKFVLGLHAV